MYVIVACDDTKFLIINEMHVFCILLEISNFKSANGY